MNFDRNLKAQLIWDGGEEVVVPPEMGRPREDQMCGTMGERLSELGLRICYDSMGIQPDGTTKKSRSSVEAHKHILEVGHHSVFEHYNFTVELKPYKPGDQILAVLMNRPGVWVQQRDDSLRVTMNLRCLLDWEAWCCACPPNVQLAANVLGAGLRELCSPLAPNILGPVEPTRADIRQVMMLDSLKLSSIELVEPEGEEECWISLYVSGSRGFSHELVRHGDRTAMSQRSTRYCNESDGDWIEHPLLTAYFADSPPCTTPTHGCDEQQASRDDLCTVCGMEVNKHDAKLSLLLSRDALVADAKALYKANVKALEAWLIRKGVDKMTALKQSRGASRGYLGNALCTELIFSASVGQWRHMLKMRAANAADAEIREVFTKALPLLKGSRYGKFFDGMELEPASDGLSMALAGGGHK